MDRLTRNLKQSLGGISARPKAALKAGYANLKRNQAISRSLLLEFDIPNGYYPSVACIEVGQVDEKSLLLSPELAAPRERSVWGNLLSYSESLDRQYLYLQSGSNTIGLQGNGPGSNNICVRLIPWGSNKVMPDPLVSYLILRRINPQVMGSDTMISFGKAV